MSRRRRTKGNMAIEAALLIPILLLCIVGTVQFGKITFTYFTLKKMVWAAGRQLASQQGVNYCNGTDDPKIAAATTFALNDPTGTPIIENLTALQFDAQCSDGDGGTTPCDTSSCDSLSLSPRPDYVLVTIPGGYAATLRIPFLNPVPITLSPSALVPTGGAI
jgi:hypothetical protein